MTKPTYKHTYIFIINTDVPMSGGKVGAQIANVACQLPRAKLKVLEEACTYVYGAPEKYMMHLLKMIEGIKYTIDAGFTEWTIGTLTCVGWKLKDQEDKEIFCSSLRLWKEGMYVST